MTSFKPLAPFKFSGEAGSKYKILRVVFAHPHWGLEGSVEGACLA